jgi:heme exporter protein A
MKAALTVSETLSFQAAILGADPVRVPEAMAAWRLERLGDVRGAHLSAGQRKRACLARLNLQYRPLWLLDEPLVTLDHSAREGLNAACDAHRVRGGSIIAASHEPFLPDAKTLDLGDTA